jgi:serine/threonine protein kinase
MFIDIGHYQWNIGSYNALASTINSLPESELDIFLSRIDSLNRQRAPMFTVGKYHVIELLGSGAFGSVYKVKRKGMDQFYAMKEIKITHPFMGKTQHEREKSMGRLLNEVTMVKEQLRHPNVVRYYKTFKENFHLYIVMELLEGAPLSEHVSSLVEKGRRFSEEQIWKLFVQLILALRYIHKEKHISHRDLSAANVMIGDDLKLTITDFGLAKQKEQDLSVMNSVVGTMPYWSPELVQSDPYTEKVDIWAAGCLLYLMAMLHPPFKAANPLALATKIVEGSYPPLPDGLYSPQLSTVIGACLTKDPSERPDCVAVGALVAAILMKEVDGLKDQVEAVKRKYEKEKEKSHKHQQEAIRARRTSERIKSASRSLQSSFAASVFEEDPLIDLEEEPENILNQSNDGPQQRVTGGDSVSSSAEQSTTTTTTSVGNSLHSFSSPPVVLHGVNHLVVRPTTSTISMTTPTSVTTTSSTRQMESASRTRSYSANESDEWSSPDVVHRRNFSSVSTVSSLGYSRERGGRSRKGSAGLVTMSPNRLKEINDPILQFLTEIHKLVCVTQVPPPATPTMRYQIVQLYKRSLFGKHSKPADLKRELHKLSSESLDPVDYFLPARTDRMSPHARLVSLALQELYREWGTDSVQWVSV